MGHLENKVMRLEKERSNIIPDCIVVGGCIGFLPGMVLGLIAGIIEYRKITREIERLSPTVNITDLIDCARAYKERNGDRTIEYNPMDRACGFAELLEMEEREKRTYSSRTH